MIADAKNTNAGSVEPVDADTKNTNAGFELCSVHKFLVQEEVHMYCVLVQEERVQ